jgi:hypothetical protein
MALTKVDQTMVSDQVFGRRRLNINGGMDVNQRGTTNNVTNAYGGPDRYKLSSSGSIGEFQLSQSGGSPDGFRNSMHVNCTTADASPSANEYVILAYQFEGFDCQPFKFGTSSAEQVTISFYVKTNKTGTYNVELYAPDNSSNPYANKQYTVSSADTWEQKILTFPCGNSAEIADDNTAGLVVHFWLGSGSTYTSGSASDGNFHNTNANRAAGNVNIADSTSNSFRITGIQVEIGDNATPFEYRSYGEELALCERYYHEADLAGNKPFWLHPLTTGDTIYRRAMYKFPTEMRAAPSVTVTNTASGYTPTTNGTELISKSKTGVICDNAGSTGYAQCDALAADAEL